MKKALWTVLALFLGFLGSVHAVDYTFSGTVFPAAWDTADNWTPTLVLPGTTGDSYTITSPTSTDNIIYLPNPGGTGAGTRYFGSVTMTNGDLKYTSTSADTFRFMADNGQDGSFMLKGTTATSVNFGKADWSQGVNWDMDGDFIYDGQVNTSERYGQPGRNSTVTMRGDDTIFTMSGNAGSGLQMVRVTVESGASVNFVEPELAGYNCTRELVINGDASGSITSSLGSFGPPANNWFVKVSGSSDVSELELKLGVTNNASAEYWASGAHYKEFEYLGAGWLGNNVTPRVYTLKLVDRDLRARNVKLGRRLLGDPNAGYFVLDTDNGGIVRNVTADLDMVLGNWWAGVLKANSAAVTIGRDLLVNDGVGTGNVASYITAATATFKLGRHLTVANGPESLASGWDMGTSLFICNGNDNGTNQTLTTKMLPFYDFQINTTGTVTLADNLLLKGDLTVTAGTFDTAGNYVVLQGGQNTEGTAQQIAVGGLDLGKLHVKAGSETWAILMSNLAVSDNLDIDAGCKLLLSGYTLDITGSDAAAWLGENVLSGVGTWTLKEGGQIIGSGVIPEPGTMLLLGTGLLGAVGYIRRRRLS